MTAGSVEPRNGRRVAVIGAGVIGACSALALTRAGFSVTLIEHDQPGAATSYGNGAIVGEESVVPVATPDMLRRLPGMLFDPLGPLTVRWSYMPQLFPWLLRFLLASRPKEVERISLALYALLRGTLASYAEILAFVGAPELLRRTGWVCVYESEAGFRRDRESHALQRRRGLPFDILDADELRQLEPSLAPIFARAVFYPDVGHLLDSRRLVELVTEAVVRQGGTLLRAEARDFEIGPDGPTAVVTDRGASPCDAVVVAAGAWSKPLAARLGSRPPLDTERGYHVQFANPGVAPRLPVYSTERAMVATPLEGGRLRFAGTVELGGLDLPPNWKRAEVLRRNGRRWFPDLSADHCERWMGFRPSMPDSLPVIGRSPRFANVVFAFGHGHCGMMLGARTGELVTALLADRDPGIDMAPYRVDRF